MIEFYIIKKDNEIVKFYGKGHAQSKKNNEKYDLLCNSVSLLPQQVVAGFCYLGYEPIFEVKNGFMEVDLRKYDFKNHIKEVDALVGSMYFMIRQLAEQYPKNIKLYEKEEN